MTWDDEVGSEEEYDGVVERPGVGRISPHLTYLREWFERFGPGVFVIGSSPDVVQDAITPSFERRRLVERGQYRPKAYLGLAFRSHVLGFARKSL